ncbi:MAG: hypothetical protein C0596_15405 [Marinilabiliales bacterium]|nr:MAG: hypothetical protein C0596_15405 [Marinilabiliales bacterium]
MITKNIEVMKNIIKIGLILLITVSCYIGKKGVFYSEMTKKPTVQIADKMIVVNTDNSNKNSALLIYKIDYSVDTAQKIIELKAYQAANKDYKNKFEIQIKELSKSELAKYEYFWLDPDNNKTKIDIVN